MIRPKPHLAGIFRQPPPAGSRMGCLRLDKNEFLPGWHQDLFEAFRERLTPELLSIHPELGPLYEKIEQVHGVDQRDVLVTAGSDAAIRATFEAFLEPGDEVVVPTPTFAMYGVYADVYRARLVPVHYDESLRLSTEQLLAAITPRTRLLAIANANSPTGTAFGVAELSDLVARASRLGVAVLVDEAYHPFYPHSMLPELGRHDNLVVTRTFSKACGLAGLRAGFAACSRGLVRSLMAQKPMYEITTLSALAAEIILENYSRVEDYARQTRQGKAYLAQYLTDCGFDVFPGEANFLHVDLGAERDQLVAGLEEQGVLFKARFDHPSLRRFCRFTVGPQAVMAGLVEIFESIRNHAVAGA